MWGEEAKRNKSIRTRRASFSFFKLVEICFQVNDVAPIGSVLAKIEVAGANNVVPSTTVETAAPAPTPIVEEIESIPYVPAAPVNTAPQETSNTEARFYSPLVLNIAQSEGVSLHDLEKIPGTGSGGRVSKKDILNWVAAKKSGTTPTVASAAAAPVSTPVVVSTQAQSSTVASAPTAASPAPSNIASNPAGVVLSGASEIIEMDRMRKLIAKHMVDSVQTSPHVTSFSEADVTNLVQWRNNNKAAF